MKSAKSKVAPAGNLDPVWCYRCYIRIAPYDLRTVSRGKDYHREYFAKSSHANGKAVKN